jgi:hypothetical protein
MKQSRGSLASVGNGASTYHDIKSSLGIVIYSTTLPFNNFLGPLSAYSVKLSHHITYKSGSVERLSMEMLRMITVEFSCSVLNGPYTSIQNLKGNKFISIMAIA